MNEVYQLTFFLSLGLLALVVTIFVLAASLLGRATESASNQQSIIINQKKKTSLEQIEKLEAQLETAKTKGHLDESIILEDLENNRIKSKEYDSELKRIRSRLALIRLKGAVIYPGSIFLGAIVFDILSTGLSSVNNNIAISLWIISVILIAAGIYRLLGTVSAIESVTITSSEYSEKLPQAVKTALMEIEEAKRPVPFVYFTETQFPLHLQPHSKKDLEASISLANGQYADDVEIHFALSPGLTFVDKQTYTFSKDHTYKNYTCYKYSRPKILRGMTYHDLITIESSSTQGSLKMIYYIFCKGFWMDNPVELEIVVD